MANCETPRLPHSSRDSADADRPPRRPRAGPPVASPLLLEMGCVVGDTLCNVYLLNDDSGPRSPSGGDGT